MSIESRRAARPLKTPGGSGIRSTIENRKSKIESPLGATWDGMGVNFAISSENATAVEVCLFDGPTDGAASATMPLTSRTNGVWHGYLPRIQPGQLYGYRVHGPYAPHEGRRFNPAKLLLDPYARAISGPIIWNDALHGYARGDSLEDQTPDSRDSAAFVPKCVVLDPTFDWKDDRPPRIPWDRTVIYECHVKGLTIRHPDVPRHLRGTYLGLASEPVVDHLLRLGVTAVELLPVHHAATEGRLAEKGLTNYWGYNTIGFFAPDARFATGGLGRQVHEFKTMVQTLHGAGLEVILDVVYNHTAEGDHLGPTLCFRGIDNAGYYHLDPGDRRRYLNYSGCGSSLNMTHPRTVQLVLDSLRYWVREMHVDGFRFDLATTLGRKANGVDFDVSFFSTLQEDPLLSHVKLIAEPWDVGEGGYQLGRFPPGWAEWNDKYRDTVRRFWRGDAGQMGLFASRVAGSSDLFDRRTRGPCETVNFVTSHDGFTLHDLVSYECKHNQANGEEGRDGADENFSRNWGVEGPTDDPDVNARRERVKRNLLATLALSQGVPMLTAGDELGRTQLGNNNAYCQDNEISWGDWDLDEPRRDFLGFLTQLMALRRQHPQFRRVRFFDGRHMDTSGLKDVAWLRPDGAEMTEGDWHDDERSSLAVLLHGFDRSETGADERRDAPETLFLAFNSGPAACEFLLPAIPWAGRWEQLLDTAEKGRDIARADRLHVSPECVVLLAFERE